MNAKKESHIHILKSSVKMETNWWMCWDLTSEELVPFSLSSEGLGGSSSADRVR